MTTCDFLRHDICCKFFCPSNSLRNSVEDRKIINYRAGERKLNKELDIGVVLKKIRQFSYFMKSMLTKNQINLLKLKSSKFLPSSDEMEGVGRKSFKKIVDKTALLNNYTDELMLNHDQRDLDLLEITSLHQIVELLEKPKQKYGINN